MKLYEIEINVSGEVVKYYRYADDRHIAYQYAVTKAVKDYQLSLARILGCDYSIKESRRVDKADTSDRYNACRKCKKKIFNDDFYHVVGLCSACNTERRK